MRNLLSLAIVLALPAVASANESCLVSFAGAQQNVCDGKATASAPVLSDLLSLAAVSDSTLRVVKFGGPITAKQREAVEATGASIVSYAPYYAYVVRMPANLDAAMRRIDGVVWSGPMMPALKVDPNILNQIKGDKIIEGLGIETLDIAIESQANRSSVQAALSAVAGLLSVDVVESGGEIRARAKFNAAQLATTVEQLALRDDVLSIGFRKPVRLQNSQGHWLHQSGVNTPTPQMPIWNKGLYGCGQIVGELDTGLYMDNVAFKDASQTMPIDVCTNGANCPVIPVPNYDARKVVAYYKWSGLSGGNWADNHGHGTHVAGSIIGNDNVSNPGTDCVGFTTPGGDTNLDGMAPGAKLVMQESGGNLAYLNTAGGTPYHAADVAYQNGARIHSNSWGGGCTNQFGQCVSGCTVTYDDSARDADLVMNDRSDLLMVFAAGNDATACSNGNNVGSPGNSKNVLTIGGNGRGTNGNNTYTSSSRGPTLDARTKPDLTAQAVSIVSAARNASGTTTMSGTSMATPTAAGNAALVRDYLARGFYPSGVKNPADAITNPSGALIKAIMTAGAFKMTGSGVGVNPGQAQGFGRVLLDDSLYFAGDQSRLFIHDETAGLQTGSVKTEQLTVVGGERLTIVLTWSDVAAAINASPATVNSLRLEVQAPNGDVWTQKLPSGYNVNNANPTQDTTGANYDNLNNLHRIQFDAPVTGVYQVRVRGINVPSGPQKYALAATGNFETGGDVDLYKVKGSTVGLAGSGLTLRLNNSNDLPVSANGPFEFAGGLPTGASYAVTVGTQPSSPPQNCTVANGSGTIGNADVTNVSITCVTLATYTIGGTVSGYTGSGLKLKLNGGSEQAIAASGPFTFTGPLVDGSPYAVAISAQPAGQICTLANGSGTVSGANVTNVAVNCADLPPAAHTVGGRVRGLTSPGLVLQLNGGVTITQNTNGLYAFYPGVSTGQAYAVTVLTQPAGLECVVSNPTGTMGNVNVTNVDVDCAPPAPDDTIFKDGFESEVGGTCTPAQLFQDPGFEATVDFENPYWASTDTLGGTSFCDSTCDDGGEFVARTGEWFTWFGGWDQANQASLSQSVVLPAGSPRWLNYWMVNQIGGDSTASLTLSIDGSVVTTITPASGQSDWASQSFQVPSQYLDGQSHAIRFDWTASAPGAAIGGAMIDDVTLDCAQGSGARAPSPLAQGAVARKHGR